IDLVDLRGPVFADWDRLATLVELVRGGMAEAGALPPDGRVLPPTQGLHKKPGGPPPGTFAAPPPGHGPPLAAPLAELPAGAKRDPIGLFALTAEAAFEGQTAPSATDLLARMKALRDQGAGALLFKQRELYRMTAFVNRFTEEPVRLAVGL